MCVGHGATENSHMQYIHDFSTRLSSAQAACAPPDSLTPFLEGRLIQQTDQESLEGA